LELCELFFRLATQNKGVSSVEQDWASIFLVGEEVVVVIAFVSHLLLERNFSTHNLLTCLVYSRFQLDVKSFLYISYLG